MTTPRERAVELALKELEDWYRHCGLPHDLETIIKNAVEYGYQAATVDMDASKRGIKCSLKSTIKPNQT
jgi:hypothetical protein